MESLDATVSGYLSVVTYAKFCASPLAQLRGPVEKPNWTKSIWFSGNIPRASFTSWLAWLNRLPTKDRLLRWNVQLSTVQCEFCGDYIETKNHLFFSCNSMGRIWQALLATAGQHRPLGDWESESGWLLCQGGKTVDSIAYRLLWTQYIYTIWWERNKRIFEKKAREEAELVRHIFDTVKLKLNSLPRLEHRIRNSRVANYFGLVCT